MGWSKEKQALYIKGYSVRNATRLKKYKGAWYLANRVRLLTAQAKRRTLNRERSTARDAKYRLLNRAKVQATRAAWRVAHPNAAREWRRMNPDKCSGYVQAHRAKMLKATPKWANKFFISEAYHLAKLRTEALGFPWHVDHIIPLRSKRVCGLHTEQNLRVIPGVENVRKNNRFWPDMPESITVRQGSLSGA